MDIHAADFLLERDMKHTEHTMLVLRGKWKSLIVLSLSVSDKRFSEIMRDIPKITTRMLSRELKDLEGKNLISRISCRDAPGAIDYHLTSYGHSLQPVLTEMIRWSRASCLSLDKKEG